MFLNEPDSAHRQLAKNNFVRRVDDGFKGDARMAIFGVGGNTQNLVQQMQQRRQNSDGAENVAQSGESGGAQLSATGFQSALGALQAVGSTPNTQGGGLPAPLSFGAGGSGSASTAPILSPISGAPVSPPSPVLPPISGAPLGPPSAPVLPPISGTPVNPPSSGTN